MFTCSLSYKTIITWYTCSTHIFFVCRLYHFNDSWFTADSCSTYKNIPYPRQYYISYYTYPLYYLVNIGNLITYQFCILWPRSNPSYFSIHNLSKCVTGIFSFVAFDDIINDYGIFDKYRVWCEIIPSQRTIVNFTKVELKVLKF